MKRKERVCLKKNKKKEVENQKKKFNLIVSYLVDSYYLNPQSKFVVNEIRKKLKIKDTLLIEELISYLKKEKYIILNKKTNSFLLKYEGFIYLETIQKNNVNGDNNIISIIISMLAFLASSFGIVASDEAYVRRGLYFVVCAFGISSFVAILNIIRK